MNHTIKNAIISGLNEGLDFMDDTTAIQKKRLSTESVLDKISKKEQDALYADIFDGVDVNNVWAKDIPVEKIFQRYQESGIKFPMPDSLANVYGQTFIISFSYKNRNVKDYNWIDTSRLTSMYGMFFNNTYIHDIQIDSWDVRNVKDMSYMFQDCDIRKIDLSKWNMSNVQRIKGMFLNCRYLQQIDITGWKIYNLTDMRQAFMGCQRLTKIKGIEDLDVSGVKNLSMTFSNSDNIKADLSNWNISPDCNKNNISTGYRLILPA